MDQHQERCNHGFLADCERIHREWHERAPDRVDQRQKLLRMTHAGAKFWDELPGLALINKVAFDGVDVAHIAAGVRVLQTVTERLEKRSRKEINAWRFW